MSVCVVFVRARAHESEWEAIYGFRSVYICLWTSMLRRRRLFNYTQDEKKKKKRKFQTMNGQKEDTNRNNMLILFKRKNFHPT